MILPTPNTGGRRYKDIFDLETRAVKTVTQMIFHKKLEKLKVGTTPIENLAEKVVSQREKGDGRGDKGCWRDQRVVLELVSLKIKELKREEVEVK